MRKVMVYVQWMLGYIDRRILGWIYDFETKLQRQTHEEPEAIPNEWNSVLYELSLMIKVAKQVKTAVQVAMAETMLLVPERSTAIQVSTARMRTSGEDVALLYIRKQQRLHQQVRLNTPNEPLFW